MVTITMDEEEMRMATMVLKDEYAAQEIGFGPRPSWEELASAFRRVEDARSEVDDLKEQMKEAKERLKTAEGTLAGLGRRVRGG